jgi:hypothetical protein
MARIAPSALEPALRAGSDPLAADLLARLLRTPATPHPAKATRPYPIRTALRIYRRKALEGDRAGVHTDGYPALLAALSACPEGDVIVHGVRFADAVFLVFTDPERRHCLGLLRKRLSRPDHGP